MESVERYDGYTVQRMGAEGEPLVVIDDFFTDLSSPQFMGHFEAAFQGWVGGCLGPDAAEHDCIAGARY